jgi:RimJ/RimL family protein N-acetyltransferase
LLSTLFIGRAVRLTPVSVADTPTIARWQDDSGYLRMLDAKPSYPKNESQVSDWIRDGQRERDRFVFGIRTLANDELIGFIELGDILWNHRVAWLAIGIGDAAHRGQGYGKEAMSLVLNFAFNELNLHRIQLTVFGYNEPAIALYEGLGFRREGTYREFMQRDGQRFDMYLYGILRHEWAGTK